MKDNCKFIGIVTDVIDEYNFIFQSDNNVKCQVQQIVCINIVDNIYMLANIVKIDVNYFLNNSQEYFTSIATDNKLIELTKEGKNPKYSKKNYATCLGIYELDNINDIFIESKFSINKFTPSVFQKVFLFNFECIETVYGLGSKSLKVGKLLYPDYSKSKNLPDVNIPYNSFNCHTLISGITGAGKSRLASLIVKHLGSNSGHVSIIDPHDEYINLLLPDKNYDLFKYYIEKENKINNTNVINRDLAFSTKVLIAPILTKLLPELSDQQQIYIYDFFKQVKNKDDILLNDLIGILIKDFNQEYVAEYPENKEDLNKAKEFANITFKDNIEYINRYVSYISSQLIRFKGVGKTKMIFAVIKKLIEVSSQNIFHKELPSWLDSQKRKVIHIINVDYDSNEYIRRYINTVLQCYLIKDNVVSFNRTLVIDEAHLLLRENSLTTKLLNRLLRESRKLGISIIFITQNEEDVPEEIRGQFQNKFRFREESNNSLKYLPNQTCSVSLFGSKLDFSLKVDSILKVGEIVE